MTFRSVQSLLVATFGLLLMTFSTAIRAQHDTAAQAAGVEAKPHEKKEGGFNVTETILEHIKDNHSWHLWGHTSIHLPVILYSD